MPRPKKCRRVCCLPTSSHFEPIGRSDVPAVVMSVDEFETVRLIDHLGLSQEECSAYLSVARTTAQQIYTSARKKIACALVEGRPLRIEGGDYRLCEGDHPGCGNCGCWRHRLHGNVDTIEPEEETQS